jgi:hypothetical protein
MCARIAKVQEKAASSLTFLTLFDFSQTQKYVLKKQKHRTRRSVERIRCAASIFGSNLWDRD